MIGGQTITEHEKLLALANSNLRQQREQVIRNTLRVLTHNTTGVSTSGVEVTQQSSVPLGGFLGLTLLGEVVALSVDKVGDGSLNGELGVSVRVGGAQGAVFGDGDHIGETSRIAVDGGGAGEDNVVDIVFLHGAEEVDGAVDIDEVVIERFFARLADGLPID